MGVVCLPDGSLMDYYDYLKTQEWQKRRSERLKIDRFKCQICGRPMDLQVHHLNYDNVGNEDVYTDLITLCKYCHKELENQKTSYKQTPHLTPYREAWKYDRQLELRFCYEHEQDDYSNGGRLNLTNLEVIRTEWQKWLNKQHLPNQDIRVTTVINYFRMLRIRYILAMKDAGASPDEIMARGISRNMVYKYFNDRELAERVIQYSLKEMEEYK